MRVFLTGATGFVGSAIVKELLEAGHQVLGLARSDEKAKALAATGAEVFRGALDDEKALARAAGSVDGVIHTAYIHDFSNIAASGVVDLRVVEAMGAALAGSGRPLVVTSGTAVLPQGRVATEKDEPVRGTGASHRVPSEDATRALTSKNVRGIVVRLPPSVHDRGDHGFVPALIGVARQTGLAGYIGDGTNRWPAVHRLDAARVFRLALEKGVAGTCYHAVGDEGIPTKAIAELIGKQLNLPVASVSSAQAAAHFSWLASFFGLDVPCSSGFTQQALGWKPVHAGLLEDLALGHYFGH